MIQSGEIVIGNRGISARLVEGNSILKKPPQGKVPVRFVRRTFFRMSRFPPAAGVPNRDLRKPVDGSADARGALGRGTALGRPTAAGFDRRSRDAGGECPSPASQTSSECAGSMLPPARPRPTMRPEPSPELYATTTPYPEGAPE
eukprot:gene13922-biopygen1012